MPKIPCNTVEQTLRHRLSNLKDLLGLVAPVPEAWLSGAHRSPERVQPMDCQDCQEWRLLVRQWRKALRWTDGLDYALGCMLATIVSTKTVGDQLWMKVMGPAGCGKSTLCEAVSTSRQFVLAKSTIRGFHSGFGDGQEDNSLIAQLYDKTLVTKDGDTLLQSPNLGQILSEARDLYDCTSRTHYRNRTSRDYAGVRMTWLLCGTSSLRSIDSSELGERFLDCLIMEGIDDDLEDEVLLRVAYRAERNLSFEANGKMETQQDPAMAQAMQLTGGYVNYLRRNATELLGKVTMPEASMLHCICLGKLVAYMRARPSKVQEETSEREFGARLVSQHVRLAKCLAVVLNRRAVDRQVMARVQRVALDTARGDTLEIVKQLYEAPDGMETKAVSLFTSMTQEKTRSLLRFLRKIGVVTLVERRQGRMTSRRWTLTPRLRALWKKVLEGLDTLETKVSST